MILIKLFRTRKGLDMMFYTCVDDIARTYEQAYSEDELINASMLDVVM